MTGAVGAAGSAVDRLLAAYDHPAVPGAAVAVLRDGVVVLEREYGLADLEARRPVSAGTAFRLASITKQFTARAIALLVDDGRLTLDTPIGKVLAGLPAWAADVRIGHLVVHSSGLPHYEPMIPRTRTSQVTDRDVVRLAASAADVDFAPGSRFEYSNTGYALLAAAVEEVTGSGFTEFLDTRIFRPLGMTDTVAHVRGTTVVRDRAFGYRPEDGGFADADQGVTTAVLGDGGIYSSIRDLARWDAALHDGWQPDRSALAPFTAPAASGVAHGYGFGWFLDTFHGRRRQRHEGWSTGFQHEIQRFPESGLTVIMLTNRASPPVRPTVESIVEVSEP